MDLCEWDVLVYLQRVLLVDEPDLLAHPVHLGTLPVVQQTTTHATCPHQRTHGTRQGQRNPSAHGPTSTCRRHALSPFLFSKWLTALVLPRQYV